MKEAVFYSYLRNRWSNNFNRNFRFWHRVLLNIPFHQIERDSVKASFLTRNFSSSICTRKFFPSFWVLYSSVSLAFFPPSSTSFFSISFFYRCTLLSKSFFQFLCLHLHFFFLQLKPYRSFFFFILFFDTHICSDIFSNAYIYAYTRLHWLHVSFFLTEFFLSLYATSRISNIIIHPSTRRSWISFPCIFVDVKKRKFSHIFFSCIRMYMSSKSVSFSFSPTSRFILSFFLMLVEQYFFRVPLSSLRFIFVITVSLFHNFSLHSYF